MLIVGLLGASLWRCEAAIEEVSTKDGTPTDIEAGSLAIDDELSPAAGLEVISDSMASSADAGEVHPGALATNLLDTQCSDSGTTGVSVDTAIENEEEGKLAALFAYCNLTHPSNGPDTAQGAIARVKGILCFLEGELEFDGQARDKTIAFETDCFTQSFVSMLDESVGKNSFDGIVTAYDDVPADFQGSTAFDKAIIIQIDEVDFYYKVLYTHDVEAGTLAASIRDGSATATDKAAFAVFLDQSEEGSLRYEGLFGRDSRHVRALVEGHYSATDEAFTDVTNVEFLSWEDFGSNPANARFQSVKGNPTDGYQAVLATSGLGTPLDVSTYDTTGSRSYCYGAGTCQGNLGLIPTQEDDARFLKAVLVDDSSYVDPFTWFANHGPLSFTEVTFTAEQN